MGEISEMMLDGTLCQFCGEYMGEGEGYPGTCWGCSNDGKPTAKRVKREGTPRVRPEGMTLSQWKKEKRRRKQAEANL